ncbi:MAG: 50S ribosomal protein L20 [Candidatus Moranbacteria bacterium GW2011_GWF2_36_839]|nr:MAG: 50S ribosomal protein L20 [Candidatus Moranbacteria bacterium GW2011_GWF1_36_78]KKQ16387.1 MAG: 50S ribosomal protein L20 [Candidatus Moranbacteria bacterium GW2011_GWF2_36_839]HAT74352.1 50S ribosomal protein L20 [Candidatus Moranbacteria bacterium]HBY11229.1 50S ribosomal protein L20 [Candidatus Moranbacteria bacterium]
MTRVKRGVSASKRRKNLLEDAKGYRWKRKSHYAAAKQAVIKAGSYAYRDRRVKKRTMRALWITRLNIALREVGQKYSTFIKILTDKKIEVDRKVLSQLAMENPEVFKKFVESAK